MVFTLHKIFSGDKIKDDEMVIACGAHVGNKRCTHRVLSINSEGKSPF
jgi:hypothetical protein